MHLKDKYIPNQELSKQELMVVTGIVKGLKNAEIAEIMNISVNTVKTYQARVYRKCVVRNRVELTLWYGKHIKELNQ